MNCIDAFVQPTNQISVVKVNVDDEGPGSTVVSQNETVHSELAINKVALTIANDTGYNEPYQKIRKKDDIFARFRSSSRTIDERTDVIVCNADQVHLFVQQELRRYENLKGPFYATELDAKRLKIFNPLEWWSKEKHKFPYLSKAAKQIFVIQGSSSESERHFSTAGRIVRKDKARLKSDSIEAQVLVCEGIKKRLL